MSNHTLNPLCAACDVSSGCGMVRGAGAKPCHICSLDAKERRAE